MLKKNISKTIFAIFLLCAISINNADAIILDYNFNFTLNTAIGINPFGVTAGDSVNMAIGLNTDNGVNDINNIYSMHSPNNDSDFYLTMTIGTHKFNETHDTWYGEWPVVTIRNDDWTIDTIDFYMEYEDYAIQIGRQVEDGPTLQIGSGSDWIIFAQVPMGAAPGVAPVPEPATLILMGFGLLGIAGISRKKNK